MTVEALRNLISVTRCLNSWGLKLCRLTVVEMPVVEFHYVVEKREASRICFLSTRERGLYEKIRKEKKAQKPLNIEKTTALYRLLNKVRSKRGVGGLADLAPRWGRSHVLDTPGPNLGFTEYEKEIKAKFPFGSILPRWKYKFSNIPGPGTYDTPTRCKTTKMCQTFGGPRQMKPAIETVCIARPMDRCAKCDEICDGDYWHRDEGAYLCSICMILERYQHKMFGKKELKEFNRIRNCSYMHEHEGTTAALRIMDKRLITMKARKENYLDLFLKPY